LDIDVSFFNPPPAALSSPSSPLNFAARFFARDLLAAHNTCNAPLFPLFVVLVFVVLLVLKVLKDDEERLFAKKDDDETKLAAANILFNSCTWNKNEEFG
jgi:hypothetical protein